MMIFWMGIIAPAAEEMIFRWLIYLRLRDWLKMPVAAVISGLIFGIYHGNIVQGIYASILGTAFAWILEMSGNIYSSMLLHMGANIWSLVIYRICTGSVFHEIRGADSDIDLSDSAGRRSGLPYSFRKNVQCKKKEENDIKIETR